MAERTNALFLCSRNQWRSPTAEALFKNSQTVNARSAGVGASARVKVTAKQVSWADIIFVMEKRHRTLLLDQLRADVGRTPVIVLDIPDDFQFMDADLVELLKQRLAPHLDVPN
jgi:predicted protein tyrosine phosphatase